MRAQSRHSEDEKKIYVLTMSLNRFYGHVFTLRSKFDIINYYIALTVC